MADSMTDFRNNAEQEAARAAGAMNDGAETQNPPAIVQEIIDLANRAGAMGYPVVFLHLGGATINSNLETALQLIDTYKRQLELAFTKQSLSEG